MFAFFAAAIIAGPTLSHGQSLPAGDPNPESRRLISPADSRSIETVSPHTNPDDKKSADTGSGINQLLTRLILEQIPHQFTETKDWGGQSERWDGVKFHRDGLKIKTHRRKKMVNHGTWKKYSAELLDPNRQFTIQIKNMRETDAGDFAFDVLIGAELKISARQSKWIKGVQLYSLSANGHAKILLTLSINLEMKADPSSFPPDILFTPVVTQADLIVEEFRIDRISKAGGEFAQQISRSVRGKLDEKIEKKKTKLVKKINAKLLKQKDKLRLPIADAIKSPWTRSAQPFLPDSVKSAISGQK